MVYPKFGAAGAIEEEVHTYSTEELEFRDGFKTDVFDLRHTDTVRRTNPSFCAASYGIGASDDTLKNSLGRPLDTVSLAEEEETTEPHRKATNPGQSPVLGDKLTYTDGLIFHRLRQTLTINGRGELPVGLGIADRGNTYGSTITLKPAVAGTAGPIVQGSGWYVRRVEVTDSNTDWQKFVLELVKYIPNIAEDAQENMLSPMLFTVAELDAISQWYKLSRTITLNGTDKANVEETAEIYDEVASP